MEILYLFACLGLPFYFVYDATKSASAREQTLLQVKADPLGHILVLVLLASWVGWFLWLLSDGNLSTPWSGALALGSLFLMGIWASIRRRSKKA